VRVDEVIDVLRIVAREPAVEGDRAAENADA
jgi:hypothetical protein